MQEYYTFALHIRFDFFFLSLSSRYSLEIPQLRSILSIWQNSAAAAAAAPIETTTTKNVWIEFVCKQQDAFIIILSLRHFRCCSLATDWNKQNKQKNKNRRRK